MRETHWNIKRSKDGQYYFCFIAKNGQVIVTSEMYTQKHSALEGIKSIHKSIESRKVMIKDSTHEE